MKFLAVLLCVVAVAYASEDWSHLVSKEIYPKGFEFALGSAPASRIVGGKEASPGQFPYQAVLNIDNRSLCGGSLINPNTVLTAAHCVDGATTVVVRVGAHNRNSVTQGEQSFTVGRSGIIVHSGWNANTIANDIALLRLPSPATLSATVQTIALPSDANNLYTNQVCVASGWGKSSDIAGAAAILRHVDLPVITNSVCQSSFGTYVRASNICTSGNGGKSTCNGDSGGPLVAGSGNSRVLVGVTSFGSGSGCEKGYPAVFTRITAFLSWIRTYAQL